MLSNIRARREEGFTLIELLMVVLIIGILAAIAIPVYNGQKNNAKNAAAESAVRTAIDAANLYYNQNGEAYENAAASAGVSAATLDALESSLSSPSTTTITTVPGSAVDPESLYIGCPGKTYNIGSGNFTAASFGGASNPCGAGAAATLLASSQIVFMCAVSKGTGTYCAEGNAGVWTYDKGTTATTASADVIANGTGTAVGAATLDTGESAGTSFSATGW